MEFKRNTGDLAEAVRDYYRKSFRAVTFHSCGPAKSVKEKGE